MIFDDYFQITIYICSHESFSSHHLHLHDADILQVRERLQNTLENAKREIVVNAVEILHHHHHHHQQQQH